MGCNADAVDVPVRHNRYEGRYPTKNETHLSQIDFTTCHTICHKVGHDTHNMSQKRLNVSQMYEMSKSACDMFKNS